MATTALSIHFAADKLQGPLGARVNALVSREEKKNTTAEAGKEGEELNAITARANRDSFSIWSSVIMAYLGRERDIIRRAVIQFNRRVIIVPDAARRGLLYGRERLSSRVTSD